MNHPRRFVAATAAFAAMLCLGCGPHRVRTVQEPGQDLVVLLPDSDGKTGHAQVSNKSGKVELATARDSTIIPAREAPQPVVKISADDVNAIFGDVLATLPPAPQHFTLFFEFESDELTTQSRSLVPKILRAVQDRPVPDIVVVGHTDRTGSADSNVTLGLKRANMVRSLLRDAGIEDSSIQATSHGETDLLVTTADGVFEARNRRVEISVR